MVEDVVKASLRANLERIAMSAEVMAAVVGLREFLFQRVYLSSFARTEVEKAKKILSDLYRYVLANPDPYVKAYPRGDSLERRAADFIAGMTDLYAIALFEKLFFPRRWSS
jgi:dGTPase